MLRNIRNIRNIFKLRGVINSDTPKRVSRFVTPPKEKGHGRARMEVRLQGGT